MMHARNMTITVHSKVIIRTADTDVLALTISAFAKLQSHTPEFWVDFDAGKNRKFHPIHRIFNNLGESKALALPIFYAFTSCELISILSYATKSSAWKAWHSFEEATPYICTWSHQL